MLNALQTLIDNGLSTITLTDVVNDLIDNDDIDDVDEHRRLIAFEWFLSEGNNADPSDCTFEGDGIIHIAPGNYRVLTDDEADEACAKYIEESFWAFSPDFLASETGIDKVVFEALVDKCEGANDAVHSIINGSCGVGEFVDSAIRDNGRGHFLAHYDDEEIEGRIGWYLYRVH